MGAEFFSLGSPNPTPRHVPQDANAFSCRKASFSQYIFPGGSAFSITSHQRGRFTQVIVLVRITVPCYPLAELLLCFYDFWW